VNLRARQVGCFISSEGVTTHGESLGLMNRENKLKVQSLQRLVHAHTITKDICLHESLDQMCVYWQDMFHAQ